MRSEEFVSFATTLRPQLHRYCARLMGSVLDGEDVVQDTFANAMAALEGLDPATPLGPWLFRIAHNRAIDLLRQKEMRMAESVESARGADTAGVDPEEAAMREQATTVAVSRFIELPVTQRSVVVLKDVLGQSLAEIAALLSISIDAVKGHLARGRSALRDLRSAAPALVPWPPSADAARYVALFNARNWDGLRALLAEDVELVQSTHPRHRGREEVGGFFSIYSRSAPVRLAPAWLEGQEVIAVYEGDIGGSPSYLMRVEMRDGRITFIRDYRYVRYVVAEAELRVCES